PASGARFWIRRSSEPFPSLPDDGASERHDDVDATTRALRSRLCGYRELEDQGFEITTEEPRLRDLVAGADGVLRVPACEPGEYRIVGVLGTVTSDDADEPVIGSVRVHETLRTPFQVGPPPAATRLRFVMEAGRSVTGTLRVVPDPGTDLANAPRDYMVSVEPF